MIVVYREVVRRTQAREAERRIRMNALKKDLRLFLNPLKDLTDEDYMSKFRLSKGIFTRFMEFILPHMTLPDRDDGLSREDRFFCERFMSGERNFWLIGDSGYGQQPWMITPLLCANSPQQERYNSALKRTRAVVERCFGVLKARFRCLSGERILMYSPEKTGQILYNVMIEEGYSLPTEKLHEEESDDQEDHMLILYSKEEK